MCGVSRAPDPRYDRLMTRSIAIAWAAVHLSACYGSSKLAGDASTDPAIDPPTDATDAADTAPDAIGAPCNTDSDCAVALHEDRCCSPDPVALPVWEIAADPCLHTLGEEWVANRDCVPAPCEACQHITRRYYAARCEAGTCVGVTDFCSPMVSPAPVASLDTWTDPPGGWEAFRGRVVVASGNPMKGPDSCECCFACDCTCFESEVEWTLGCRVSIRGSACGVPWECSGTECDPVCSPPADTWGLFLVQGYVVDSALDGLEIWAMNTVEDCPPPGPNPAEASCTPYEGPEGQCDDGLICFFWGDVLDRCIAVCRPPGTECAVDADCTDGDVCHQGYCVWCCPG